MLFIAFLFAGCGDSDPEMVPSGEDEVADDNTAVEDGDLQNDEENVEAPDETETDEEAVVDEEPADPTEPVEPTEPNEPTSPEFESIGTFNLNFSGAVHASVSMNDMTNLGGTGVANFVYNNQPVTFGEINIGIKLFPLAMVNNGIVIVWLDSFKAAEAMSTAHKQVFGINIPQNTEVGSGTMASANIYAFYGDMTVNVQQQLFNIDCVRSVTNVGNYEVTANDGANITLTASGDLLDPSAGAAYLPYPTCE